VVLTNIGIVVLSTKLWHRPNGVVSRLPRHAITVGPLDHEWFQLRVGREDLWVHRRFEEKLKAADLVPAPRPRWLPIEPRARFFRLSNWSDVVTAVGAAALAIGGWDVAKAASDEFRSLGVAFVFAGALLVGAGVALALDGWSPAWRQKLCLSGFAAGFACCIYLLVSSIGYGRRWFQVGFIFAAALLVVAAADTIGDVRSSNNRVVGSTGKPIVEQLTAIGISIGFLLSLLQFWYSSAYSPGHLGTLLNVSAVVVDDGQSLTKPGMHAFSGTITLENRGKSKVQVVASRYILRGANVVIPEGQDDFAARKAAAVANKETAISVYTDPGRLYGEVFAVDEAVDDLFWFEPDEKSVRQASFLVPESSLTSYGLLSLDVELLLAKGDRLTFSGTPDPPENRRVADGGVPDAVDVAEYNIKPVSAIAGLTKGKHAVAVLKWRVVSTQSTDRTEPLLWACIDNRGLIERSDPDSICSSSDRQLKLTTFYGLVHTNAVFELPLKAPAVPK
jgi:hypothetical protein